MHEDAFTISANVFMGKDILQSKSYDRGAQPTTAPLRAVWMGQRTIRVPIGLALTMTSS